VFATPRHRLRFLVAALLVTIAGALVLAGPAIQPLLKSWIPSLQLTGPAITEFIRSLGGWGMAASIGLMILHSFVPFPAELLTMANGLLYGPWLGILITWIGAMLGAYASFGLTRLLGRPFVEKVLSPAHLRQLDDWSQRQGVATLLLSRLVPLISFNLINYAAGLTGISWWNFTWTTAIGILPVTVFMVIMGHGATTLPWWSWLPLLALLGLTYLAWRRHGAGQKSG